MFSERGCTGLGVNLAPFLLSAAGAALPTFPVVGGAALWGGAVCLTPNNKQGAKSQPRRPPLSYRPSGCRPSPALPFAVPREPRCGRPCRGSGAMRGGAGMQRLPAGQRRAACLPMEAPASTAGRFPMDRCCSDLLVVGGCDPLRSVR